jgi:hypothetical protein
MRLLQTYDLGPSTRDQIGNAKFIAPMCVDYVRFADTVMVPLLSDTWSPTELDQLLEGLEQFGYAFHTLIIGHR